MAVTRFVDGIAITEDNRFSVFCRRRDELTPWLVHFQASGVPAVIVLTDAGYALYREGMEDIVDEVE